MDINFDYSNLDGLVEMTQNKMIDSKEAATLIYGFAAAFAYQGFEPLALIKELISKVEKSGLNLQQFVTISLGILTHRGTKLSKLREKSSESLKRYLDQIQRVVTTKTGSNLTAKDITLPRIAACFPATMARSVFKVNRHIVGGFDNVHPVIASNYLAAILPSRPEYMTVARVNLYWLQEFDRLIKPRDQTPMPKLMSFWRAAHASPVLSDDERKLLCDELYITKSCCDDVLDRLSRDPKFLLIQTVEFAPPVTKSINLGPIGFEHSFPQAARPEAASTSSAYESEKKLPKDKKGVNV